MVQNFHLPTKIKFAMELMRKTSVAPDSSNLWYPKRRAASPVPPDSPLSRLFNDVGIKALAREVEDTLILREVEDTLIFQSGKSFLLFVQGILRNGSPEERAKDIYDEARQVWFHKLRLLSACAYAILEEPCLSETLVAHSNNDAPEQRVACMMKDPWLHYVLGDLSRQSYAFITRGYLSILIAYWNMKDLLHKTCLTDFGRRSAIPSGGKYEFLYYALDHFQDFRNLKEVLDSKYGSDPGLVGCLFQQIRDFQVNGMNLAAKWKSGRRAMIQVVLLSIDSGPPSLCESFSFWNIP